MVNHLRSVIVFYTGLLVPFAVFFLTNFFRTVPQELIEAASVEGAGPFTVLRRVVMPLSGAATFTLVIVQSIWVWNELLIALVFLQDENSRTLSGRPRAVPGPVRDQPAACPRRRARLHRADRSALSRGTALLRARADGRHRQVTSDH
jgi:ABC-type glycerol-3-phosphate transport system permease component